MKLPYGESRPTPVEIGLFAKFCIEVDAEKTGKYYFLTFPDSPKFTYSAEYITLSRIDTTVRYNGVDLISIREKTASWDPWVVFSFDESKVDEALVEKATEAEESKADDSVELFRNLRLDGNIPRFNRLKKRNEVEQRQRFAA